jgi:hypothetical protein
MKILKRAARAHKHKRSMMSDASEYTNSLVAETPFDNRDIDIVTQGSNPQPNFPVIKDMSGKTIAQRTSSAAASDVNDHTGSIGQIKITSADKRKFYR